MTLGILGGCGAAAGAHFYTRLVSLTDAANDADHISVLLAGDSAIPDRSAYLLGRTFCDPTPALIAAGERLVAGGAEALFLICNTAHAFLPAMREALPVPIPDMIAIAVADAARHGIRSLGVLATEGTVAAGLYSTAAVHYGVRVIYPAPPTRARIHAAIYDAFKRGVPDRTGALSLAARELSEGGAEALLLGCTELSLPLAKRGVRFPLPVIDPVELYARYAVTLCGKKIKEEPKDALCRTAFRPARRFTVSCR